MNEDRRYSTKEVADLYDNQANIWKRNSPSILSDFIGRSLLVSRIIQRAENKEVLDAGCGEGYISRIIAPFVKSVRGIDLSEGMINCAIEQERENPQGICFERGDIKNLLQVYDCSIDFYISSLVAHYLLPNEISQFYKEINRTLRSYGEFHILMAHPNFVEVLSCGSKKAFSLKDKKRFDKTKSLGDYFPITLKNYRGDPFDVGIVYYSLEAHIKAIEANGLKLESLEELEVSQEIGNKFPLFDDLVGEKIYVYLQGKKSYF